MLRRTFTKIFRKQLKLAEKRGKDLGKLREVMDMIINEQPLPPERRNHPLHGDWVLIYEIDKVEHTVTFQRTGSHSDLF